MQDFAETYLDHFELLINALAHLSLHLLIISEAFGCGLTFKFIKIKLEYLVEYVAFYLPGLP